MDMPLNGPDYKVVGSSDDIVTRVNQGIEALRQNRPEEARALLGNVLALHPTQPSVWMALAEACLACNDMPGAEMAAGYAWALEPRNDNAVLALSTAIAHQGRQNECLALLQTIGKPRIDYPGLQWNLALSEISAGDWASGWKRYKWGRTSGHRPKRHERDVWDGSDIGDGVLYIHTEQGHGDTLWALRFVVDARKRCPDATIVLEVMEPWLFFFFFQPIFKENRIRLVTVQPGCAFGLQSDAHISLWDIPTAIGLTPDMVDRSAYLGVDHTRIKFDFPPEHQDRPKVGIAWKGNTAHGADKWRSIHDLTVLTPILRALNDRGVLVYSFIPDEVPDPCVFPLNLSRWEFTAANLSHMDLVITVDTAIGHLAASMGVPTWLMVPRAVDYRWGCEGAAHLANHPRDYSLWYESMRLVRQEKQGDWSSVVQRIVGAIEDQWTPLTLAERFALPMPVQDMQAVEVRQESGSGELLVPVILEPPTGWEGVQIPSEEAIAELKWLQDHPVDCGNTESPSVVFTQTGPVNVPQTGVEAVYGQAEGKEGAPAQ